MSGDARPLPPGWSAHRDERTGSMFYVNHSSQPATMSYAHPLDSAPQAAAVQQHAQAAAPPPPPQQVAHSIEYAARPASRASPQPSVSSGRSGSTGADRAQPPGTTGVRELHTVATPPVPLPPRSPPPPMHSRSVSMSMAYAPPQQLQYVPPPPPPRLASNPHRTSTYTPRLPNVQVQQPVQQQQQQPSRVTALYAAQAGVQPTGKTGRWSSFFGTPKSQPFQQQIIPLQQSVTRPPPATIYQQQQRPQIVTQPFQQQQQQFVPQQQHQFVPQQQQQQYVPQQQQLAPQQQQFVPQQQFGGQQQQQQVQQAQAAQQFVAPQQQQQQQLLVSQQMQPLPPLPQQLAIPQQQQVSQPLQQHPVVPQQQQAAVQQDIAPSTALDPQVLLQLSALLAQQQGVDQAQILQQLLVAQQQLQPVAQTQQVGPSPPPQSAVVSHQAAHGGILVTAPQPVHPIPAQLSLGPSPSPSPQSPQAALAQYAPGLGLYTSQQASPPAAVGSPPAALQQSVTASPALSASGVSSFDATFPVDMNPSSTSSPADAAVPPDAQQPAYQQDLNTPAETELVPVIQPEFVAHAEPLPATSDADHIVPGEAEENGTDSPGPLPAYSLEPPNSAPPMADSFVADATLQEMAQAAESVVEAIPDPEDTLATQPAQEFEVPAQTESSQSPVSPTQYTPGGRTVRPALPPRPSGPRSDRRLAGHAVSSHVNGGTHHSSASHAHGPGVAPHVSPSPGAVHPAPSAGLHQNSVSATPAHAASPPPAHAASPSPSISPPNGVHAQSHSPAHGTPAQQYAAYQPAAGVPPVIQMPHAQYQPAHQQQQQSPVYTQQQQQQSPIYAQQQQQQQAQQQYQQQQQQQQQYHQQQQQSASTSPPPPPPKPYAVYPDPGKQQSIGGRLSSFMSSPTTQAIAAKGAGLLGNLFVRTAVNAVTDSDSGSNYGYLNTGPSATDIAAGLAGNVVQNAIQQSIAPSPQPGLAGTAGFAGNAMQAGLAGTHTQAQLIQAQIQAQAQANTNALLQSMQGSQQAQTAAALLQAQKIQAANAQAQQQNVQAQLAALLKMQQQQQSAQQAQQQAVLQQVQQQQAAQQAQQQAALQEAQQQAALQQAHQQAILQQVQQQQAAQQAQQQAMLEQVQQQQEAQQQAAFEQLQQQTAMYQSQQQAALEQMQAQNVFTPQIFASTNYEQPNGSGMDTLAQTIAQAMPQQSSAADPYSQAFSPDGGMAQAQIQGTSPDFLGALSQAIMGGAQTASYDPSAFLGAQQPGADASAMQAMTDALSQMQLGSQQMMSGGYDGSQQQTDYSQYLSSFGANDIIDSAVTNSV